MSDIKDEAQRKAEEQRLMFEEMMARNEAIRNQPPQPFEYEPAPVLPPPVIPQGQEGGYVPMDTPTAIPSPSMYDEQPYELPLGAQNMAKFLEGQIGQPSPEQGMLRPMPSPEITAVPEPGAEGPGMLPDVGAALKSGFLDVASLMAGAGAMAGEFGRRIAGREDPFEFQQALADKYMDLSEQSAIVKRDLNDPWETAKGLFGQSEEVGVGQAITHMPSTIIETLANQAPFMAMTIGIGGLFAKFGGSAIARMASQGGKVGILAKRADKFMMDEAMRGARSQMTKAAWKKADKEALKTQLRDALQDDIEKKAIAAYGQRMGMNSGIVTGTGALESGGMFGEAYQEMGGMDNISLASTALFGTAAGMIELSLGGGNLEAIRRHLGPKAEKEALAIARRAGVADAAEIPSLAKKATAIVTKLAKASGVEATQETAQEMAAIANLVYNSPESIQDMDILERLGSSAVVGGMMGFGPASFSEFADFRQGRKPKDPTDPKGERVDTPTELKFATVLPQNLDSTDREVLVKFGQDLLDDLESVDEPTGEEERSIAKLRGSTEGFKGLNYQNPEFMLEFFINSEKSKGNSPMEKLRTLYNEQGRKWARGAMPWDPTKPDEKPAPANAHEARQEEHEAEIKKQEGQAKQAESEQASVLQKIKTRNQWRNVWRGGYKKAQLRDLKAKNNNATNKFVENLVGRMENALPPDYDWRTKTHDEVFLDMLELKAPIRETFDAKGVQELDLLRDNAGNLATLPPAPYRPLTRMEDVQARGEAAMEGFPSGLPRIQQAGLPGIQERAEAVSERDLSPEGAAAALDPNTQLGRITSQLYQVSPQTAIPGEQFGPVEPTPGEMLRAQWQREAEAGEGAFTMPTPTKAPRKKRKKKAKAAETKPAKPTITTTEPSAVPKVEGTIEKREDDGAYVVKSKGGGILGVVATKKEADALLGVKPVKPTKPTVTTEAPKPAKPTVTKPTVTEVKPAETEEDLAVRKILSRRKSKTPLTDAEKADIYTPAIEAAGLKVPRKGARDVKWDAKLREARRGKAPKKKNKRQELIKIAREKTGISHKEGMKLKAEDLKQYEAEWKRRQAEGPKEEPPAVAPAKAEPTKPTITTKQEELEEKAAKAQEKKEGKHPTISGKGPGLFTVKIIRGDNFQVTHTKVLAQIADERKKVLAVPNKNLSADMLERKATKTGKLEALRKLIEEQNDVEGIMNIISKSSIAEGLLSSPAKKGQKKTEEQIEADIRAIEDAREKGEADDYEAMLEEEEIAAEAVAPTGPTITEAEVKKETTKLEKEVARAHKPPTVTEGEVAPEDAPSAEKIEEGMAGMYYGDEDETPMYYDDNELYLDKDLKKKAKPIITLSSGDTIVTTNIDLSADNGYDLDLVQAGRGTIQGYKEEKKISPKKMKAAEANAQKERVLKKIGPTLFDKIFGEGASKKLLESGSEGEVSYEDVDIGTPNISGMGKIDIHPSSWKQVRSSVDMLVNQKTPSDLVAEILMAYSDAGETFTSKRLDEQIFGKKKPGRPFRKEIATEKALVYAANQYHKRLKGDPQGKKMFDEERINNAIEWFGRKYEDNLKKPITEPRIKALIDRVNYIFSESAKRDIAGLPEISASGGGGFKSTPSQGATETEKAQILWIDEEKAKNLIATVGEKAVFYNFYKPFIAALMMAKTVANMDKAESKAILDKRRDALDNIRRLFDFDPQAMAQVNRQLKKLEVPADKQHYGAVKKSSDFIDLALTALIGGTLPSKISGGAWEAIINITAKQRGMSIADTKEEWKVLNEYVDKLGDIAVANGLQEKVVKVSTRKRRSKYAPDVAKALGIHEKGWKVRVYAPKETAFMKAAKEKYEAGDPQYGWRLLPGLKELHTIEGFHFSDKTILQINQAILDREVKQEAPELSPEYQAMLDESETITNRSNDLVAQMTTHDRTWYSKFMEQQRKAGATGPPSPAIRAQADTYVKQQRAKSKSYRKLVAELKIQASKDLQIGQKIDKFRDDFVDKQLQSIEANRKLRLEEQASMVTDAQVAEVMRDNETKKRFKQEFSRTVINPKTGKKWSATAWGRENFEGRGKWNKDMYRIAISVLKESFAEKIGRGTKTPELDAMMKAEWFRGWWEATEGEARFKDRETWDDFMSTGKDVLATPADERKWLKKQGLSPSAIKEQMKVLGKKPTKITLFRFDKLTTEQKIKYAEEAFNWHKQRYREGTTGNKKEKAVRAKRLNAKQLRELKLKHDKAREGTIPIEEQLRIVKEALKKKDLTSIPKKLAFELVEADDGEIAVVDNAHMVKTITQQLKDIEENKPGIVPPDTILTASGIVVSTEKSGPAPTKDTGDIQMLEGIIAKNSRFIEAFWEKYGDGITSSAKAYLPKSMSGDRNAFNDIAYEVFKNIVEDPEATLKDFLRSETKNLKSFLNMKTRRVAELMIKGEGHGLTEEIGEAPATVTKATQQEKLLAEERARDLGIDITASLETDEEIDAFKLDGSDWDIIINREKRKEEERKKLHDHPRAKPDVSKDEDIKAIQMYTFTKLLMRKDLTYEHAWYLASSVKETNQPLSNTQKIAKMVSKIFGVPLYFVDNIGFGNARGLSSNGKIFIDVTEIDSSVLYVYGHEFFHALEHFASKNADWKDKFLKANKKIKKAVMNSRLGREAFERKKEVWREVYGPSFKDATGREATEAEIETGTWSEFKADIMGQSLMSESFYNELEKIDPTLFGVVKSIVRDMWDKIVAYGKALVAAINFDKMRNVETDAQLVQFGKYKAFLEGQEGWMQTAMATTPGDIAEITQAMALLASESSNIHQVRGNVVYIPGDQKITEVKMRRGDDTFDGIAYGLLNADQEVIPSLVDIASGSKYSIATIKHNIRAALGRKVAANPQRYAEQYGPALRRLDVTLYPETYGRDTETYNAWLRGFADVSVKGKPFKTWFGKSSITNGYISRLADNTGALVRPHKLFGTLEQDAPAVLVTTTATNSTELLQPQYAMAEWTNDRGEDQFAYFASVHPDGAIDFKGEHKRLEGEEHLLPVYVKSENPFDPSNIAHFTMMKEWMERNYDQIQEEKIGDRDRIVPSLYTNSEFLKFLDNRGFDSVVSHSTGLNLVVFNSKQMKSATTNNGLYLSTDSGVQAMLKGESGEKEEGPVINSIESDGKGTAAKPRNNRQMAHWRFPERALREWAKRDEIDPTAIDKIMGIFPSNKVDAKWYHEIIANPWHLREIFAKFKETHTVEVRREEGRMEFVHRHSQSTVPGEIADLEQDTRHPFYILEKSQRITATQALQLGDKYGHELSDDDMRRGYFWSREFQREVELPKLNKAQMEAIHAVRETLNAVWAERIEEMKKLILRPYHNTALYLPLKESLEKYWDKMKMKIETDPNTLLESVVITHPSEKATKEIVDTALGKLAKADHSSFTDVFTRLSAKGGKIEQIFEVNESWASHEGYFPRMRKASDYVAEIWIGTEDNKTVIWSYRPSIMETDNILKKGKSVFEYATLEKYMKQDSHYGPLLADGRANFTMRRDPRLAEDIFSEVSGADVSGILRGAINSLEKEEKVDTQVAESLYEKVFQQVSEEMKARGFGRHSIKRGERFIPGFKMGDGAEILNDYISGAAGFITKQKASWEFYKSLEKIDVHQEKKLFRYAKTFVNNMLRNTESIDHVSSKLRGVMFTMFLAGSLKPVVVNFTQNFVAGIPWLSKVAGVKDAHRHYLGAMKDVVGLINPINIFNPKGKPKIDKGNLSEEEWHYMQRAIFQGRTIDQFVRELSESFRTGRTWYHKLANYLARGFSHMEQFNRASAHLAMFRWAREQNINPEQADSMAEDFVYNTHYLIGKSNIPQWGMGESTIQRLAGRNALLFRGFTHNYLLSMARSLAKGENGKRDYTTVLVSMAYIALFGGALSVPFLSDLIELIEKITKIPLRSKARKLAYDSKAEDFFNAAALGVPSSLGLDMSGSIAITMPWGVDDAVFGVWGGAWSKAKLASGAMSAGDYSRALENILPMFASHPMRAYRSYMYPVTTPSGAVMHDWGGREFKYTSTEALWRALGFRPTREAIKQMDKRSKDILLEMMKGVRTNFYRQYAIAYNKGDKSGMAKARKKGREWNRDVRVYGLSNKLTLTSFETFEKSRKRKREGRKKELGD